MVAYQQQADIQNSGRKLSRGGGSCVHEHSATLGEILRQSQTFKVMSQQPKRPDDHARALAKLNGAIGEWTTKDQSLKKCYAADRKQLKMVMRLLLKKKWEEAFNAAWKLDTIVRDVIPEFTWDYMEDKAKQG